MHPGITNASSPLHRTRRFRYVGHDSGNWGTIPFQLKKCPASHRNPAPHQTESCPTSRGFTAPLRPESAVAPLQISNVFFIVLLGERGQPNIFEVGLGRF